MQHTIEGTYMTHRCKTCHYVYVVPPDYLGEPVCPNCIYEKDGIATPLMIEWYFVAVAFLLGFGLGALIFL